MLFWTWKHRFYAVLSMKTPFLRRSECFFFTSFFLLESKWHSVIFETSGLYDCIKQETERVDSQVLDPSPRDSSQRRWLAVIWKTKDHCWNLQRWPIRNRRKRLSWFPSHSRTDPTRWLVITILLSESNSLGTSVECSQMLAGIWPKVFKSAFELWSMVPVDFYDCSLRFHMG